MEREGGAGIGNSEGRVKAAEREGGGRRGRSESE